MPIWKLTDQQCLDELVESKHQLEQITGQAVSSFAYPFGIYSERDVELVRQANYTNAVTTVEGIDNDQPDFCSFNALKSAARIHYLQ
jgi:peptidoglycan/xylan/chitin deacetylase (PgdA/CDA1 family)